MVIYEQPSPNQVWLVVMSTLCSKALTESCSTHFRQLAGKEESEEYSTVGFLSAIPVGRYAVFQTDGLLSVRDRRDVIRPS